MKSMQKSLIIRGMIFLHFAVMAALFFGFWNCFYRQLLHSEVLWRNDLVFSGIYTFLLFLFSRVYNAYKVGLLRVGELVFGNTLANLLSLGITYVLACAIAHRIINPLAGFGLAAVQLVLTFGWVWLANQLYFKLNKPKRTVVIYRSESDLRKLEEIRNFDRRWKIEKQVKWQEGNLHDIPWEDGLPGGTNLSDIHRLINIMKDYENVFVSGVNATLRNGIVKYCVESRKDCYFVPHTGDVIISGATHMKSFAVPIFRVRRSRPTPEYLFVKRAVDIVLSLVTIVVTCPLMLVTAIAIKQYDHGPALYRQVRLTKDGRPFEILKFRSMKIDAEKDGVARLASENDDRITPVGKVIRAIRFDELPQLFNILRGDMSIVGPRPERPEIAAQYRQELPAFDLRLQVKAGLTGYAQVYGRYNTEPQDKLKMDLMYVNQASLLEDIKLMFATVQTIFQKESTHGISDGQVTASKLEREISIGSSERA